MLLAALAAVIVVMAVPSSSSAAFNVRVGIGDQSYAMLAHPSFKPLKIKRVRYFVKWDARKRRIHLRDTDGYVNAMRLRGIEVYMHISTNDLRRKRAKLPSVKAYKKEVGWLIRRYRPMGVKIWGAWNEANHDTQPTYKSPKRAAQFFLTMRSLCKGCTIVGLDVLDQRGSARYISRFFKALGRKRSLVKIVGIHNYADVNRRRSTGTRTIMRAARKGNRRAKFWLTETGGLARFGKSFPCNPKSRASRRKAEARQARAVKQMFSLTKKYRKRIQRLYAYNWSGTDCRTRFDAGLIRRNGSLRPAYKTFIKYLKQYKR
jgi:hypothetical protein